MTNTQSPQTIAPKVRKLISNSNGLYKKGRHFTVDWNSLVLSETYLPELEDVTLNTVDFLLGFRPAKAHSLPQEPFLRNIMNDYKNRKIGLDGMLALSAPHVKLIRNACIGDHADPIYEDKYLWKYETFLLEYKDKARQRLAGFLGYKPDLQHSMIAEIHLRTWLASDQYYLPDGELTRDDLKLITIIKYREALLTEGKAAADNSPLPAMDIIAQHMLNKKR